MKSDMFHAIGELSNVFTVRKKSENGQKVEWLKIQWLQVRKQEPYRLFFKYTVQEDLEFSSINLLKTYISCDISTIKLKPLYTERRVLSVEKVADVKRLLKYVPPVHHTF